MVSLRQLATAALAISVASALVPHHKSAAVPADKTIAILYNSFTSTVPAPTGSTAAPTVEYITKVEYVILTYENGLPVVTTSTYGVTVTQGQYAGLESALAKNPYPIGYWP